MTRLRASAFAVLIALAAAVGVGVAYAAPATTAPGPATGTVAAPPTEAPAPPARVQQLPPYKPASPRLIDVQVWAEDQPGSSTLIVVGILPTDTPLPARVTLPLPPTARVSWTGEVFPNGTGQDIPREGFITSDTVTIGAQKSRLVQYEALYAPFTEANGRRTVTMNWIQSAPAGSVHFAFRIPPGATNVKTVPAYVATPESDKNGNLFYSLPVLKPKTGEKVKATASYSPLQAAVPPPTSSPDYLLIGLFVLLGLAVAAILFVLLRGKQQES